MVLDEIEAQKVLKANITASQSILDSRDRSDVLFALLHGDDFNNLLIDKIEYIESENKAKARKKFARNVVHVSGRLLRPVANVYSANGGSIHIDLEGDEKEILINKMSRTRDGKSLREWLKTFWMPLYHSDPNGVIFIEYTTKDELDCWPTYKQISHIQAYKPKGQLLEWILFAPTDVVIDGKKEQVIRLVDDVQDRTYQKKGDEFILLQTIGDKSVTFPHPFGQVPALINSDIENFRGNNRLTPVEAIIPNLEEYARDQSIKTIYKTRMGLPTEWKLSDQCGVCLGSGKNKDKDGACPECDGHGYYTGKDITDIKYIATPESDEAPIRGEDTGGFISPPTEVLQEFRDELKDLDESMHSTHWGTLAGFTTVVQKTATQVFFDSQPMTDKLNDYGDVAEMMEGQIVEWFANLLVPTKTDKSENIASISYGRRYIIDPPDVILEKYERAKKEGDNNTILDRLFNEYLTARYRRDLNFLRIMLLKASIEPYLHLKSDEVLIYFGAIEVQKKILFQNWWATLSSSDFDKSVETLKTEFDKWFTDQNKTVPTTGDGENE